MNEELVDEVLDDSEDEPEGRLSRLAGPVATALAFGTAFLIAVGGSSLLTAILLRLMGTGPETFEAGLINGASLMLIYFAFALSDRFEEIEERVRSALS